MTGARWECGRGWRMEDVRWGPGREQGCWMKGVGWGMQDRDVAGLQDENMAGTKGCRTLDVGWRLGTDQGCRMGDEEWRCDGDEGCRMGTRYGPGMRGAGWGSGSWCRMGNVE